MFKCDNIRIVLHCVKIETLDMKLVLYSVILSRLLKFRFEA